MSLRRTLCSPMICPLYLALLLFTSPLQALAGPSEEGFPAPPGEPATMVIGVGDSLTHGTMDATNNWINTLNAYLQRVVNSLSREFPVYFKQPLFDTAENRIRPLILPTNLAVDGADAFSVEGISYYKRAGAETSFLSQGFLGDRFPQEAWEDKYDKVLHPINLLERRPVSSIGAALRLMDMAGSSPGIDRVLVFFNVGSNESSNSALGLGGSNPEFQPLPLEQISPEISPLLRVLTQLGEQLGLVSFDPYTQQAVERNLTELDDFSVQYNHLLDRLLEGATNSGVDTELFAFTLGYYNAVGYLMDSEDIEFYLRKSNPDYVVPSSFARVAPPGEPILDPLAGDRISLLTFGFMYLLLETDYSIDYVNQVLETNGQQRDGLVLSEAEQQIIQSRIDGYNAIIAAAADAHPKVHLLDVATLLKDALTGEVEIVVGGRVIGRKWIRGSFFSLDGVHPDYTGQSVLSNFVLDTINPILGTAAAPEDLETVFQGDPYIDLDGDGWAPGPGYAPPGLAQLLFLFTDSNDQDASQQVQLPPDVWDLVSDVLLEEILGSPGLREEAIGHGLLPQ